MSWRRGSGASQAHKSKPIKAMNIGDNFTHKYLNITCQILAITKRGAKVIQQEGKKKKTAFYDAVDFENSGRGLWNPA